MQIKVFKAGNMKDAMMAMKAELGEDAVILHSKKYKEGGILGIGSREVVEITAAVEESSLPKKTEGQRLSRSAIASSSSVSRYKTDGSAQDVAGDEQGVKDFSAESQDENSHSMQIDALAEQISAQKKSSALSKNFEDVLQEAQDNSETVEENSQPTEKIEGSERNSETVEEKSETTEENSESVEKLESIEENSEDVEKSEAVEENPETIEGTESVEENSQPTEKSENAEDNSEIVEKSETDVENSQLNEKTETVEKNSQLAEKIQPVKKKSESIANAPTIEKKSESIANAPTSEEKSSTDEKLQPQQVAGFTQEQMAQTQAMLMAQFNQMQMIQQAAIAQAQAQAAEQLRLQQAAQAQQQAATVQSQPTTQNEEKIQKLEEEIAQMKALLAEILGRESKSSGISLHEALRLQEVEEEILKAMAAQANAGDTLVDMHAPAAKTTLTNYLNEHMRFSDGVKLNRHGVRIVALLGTTGVGKTTTLAKIAAKFVLEQRTNVALITSDTYRISAVEQLKTYSDILELPLEIVYNPPELATAIERHRHKELILIDTAGRSQHNEYQMRELEEFLRVNPRIEKHLVISATTKFTDAKQIMNKFAQVHPDKIIFTKIDETGSVGMILNLLNDSNYSLSYITTGQSVPDDIERANAEVLANLLLQKVEE